MHNYNSNVYVIRVKRREIQTLHCSKRFNFSTPPQPRILVERAIQSVSKRTNIKSPVEFKYRVIYEE
jgi:hypothetical protein